VIQELPYLHSPEEKNALMMSSKEEQLQFLSEILTEDNKTDMTAQEQEEEESDNDQLILEKEIEQERKNMKVLSGANDGLYFEF